jgi:hypothetical protein
MSDRHTDQGEQILPNPLHYPPEQEAEFLTFGMDEKGHTLRILVDGKHHWIRVGFKDVDSMHRGQVMVKSGVFKSISMLQPFAIDDEGQRVRPSN